MPIAMLIKGVRTFDTVEYRGYVLVQSDGDRWRTGRSRTKSHVSEPPLIVFKIENDKRRVKITDAN